MGKILKIESCHDCKWDDDHWCYHPETNVTEDEQVEIMRGGIPGWCPLEDVLDKNAVLLAISDEPELPGIMPIWMSEVVMESLENKDIELITELLRMSVRATKAGIANRIKGQWEAPE